MNKSILIIFVLVLVLFLFPIILLSGCGSAASSGGGGGGGSGGGTDTFTADIYVSVTGDDTNEGTLAHPFATIQHAMDVVSSHETIGVLAGTYDEYIT